MVTQPKYTTPWGNRYTYNELTSVLAQPLTRILRYRLSIPDDLLDDAEQSAYIFLWTKLQEAPDFLLQFRCRGPVGLAIILSIRGQKRAFNHSERSYRERYPLSPQIEEYADILGNPFPWNVHSPRELSNTHKSSRPFATKRLDATRKDLSETIIVNGHTRTWRDITELRIDLETAIAKILADADPIQRHHYEVGIECLLFGKPCPEAARQYHIPVTSVKRYMYQVRDLLRPHFKPYLP